MDLSDSFNSPTYGQISTRRMLNILHNFMQEFPSEQYRLVIGTDSKSGNLIKKQVVNFITAIVIYRQGKGGLYFWQKNPRTKIVSLRDKIYTETILSLQMAEKLVPKFTKDLNGLRYQLEIHIDVGDFGPTRTMIKEVVGMVTGSGYVAKTKPESYGASSIADKHT